ncbi:MAG: hypothetical protein JKY54_18965 [Flavobacteriales bacterium]|nr:hypothetical protein [Flavobacteriales bacterium]
MKKLLFPILIFAVACGTEETTLTPDQHSEETIVATYEYTTATKWNFNREQSKVVWSRVLDQKPTKKKVKFLGAFINLELGNVKATMEGDVSLEDAYLNDENGDYINGLVQFDMVTFQLAKEKGEGLFNTIDHPHSTLEFLSFSYTDDSVNNFVSNVKMTIQGHSEEFEIALNIASSDSNLILKGEFDFNTLDFPLREAAKKKDVNKDVITVGMDIRFELGKSVKDSVRNN